MVAVDDREGGVTFDIEQNNLDTRSNISVYPDDDDIRIGVEDETHRDIEVDEVNPG